MSAKEERKEFKKSMDMKNSIKKLDKMIKMVNEISAIFNTICDHLSETWKPLEQGDYIEKMNDKIMNKMEEFSQLLENSLVDLEYANQVEGAWNSNQSNRNKPYVKYDLKDDERIIIDLREKMQKTSQQVTNTFFKDYETYFKKQKDEKQIIVSELTYPKRTKAYDARQINSTIDNWLAKAKKGSYKVEIDKTDFDMLKRVSAFSVSVNNFLKVHISLKYNDIDGSSLTISRIKTILESSDSLEFQRITQLAAAKLNELDTTDPIPDLLDWISSYHDLTSKPCNICNKLLNYDSFKYKYLPPIVRLLQAIDNEKKYSIMKRLRFSNFYFQFHRKPNFTSSFLYFSKLPSEPSSLKDSLQQRHKPYSVHRGIGEEEKLREAANISVAGSSNSSQPFSLGQEKQHGKEMTVSLTEQELNICDLLRKVTTYLKETNPELPSIELRIAGGWVRDKLLGFECNDLDVAINHLTGLNFANYVKEFVDKEHMSIPIKIHLIESNPEKSKHLDTATTNIFGLDIDFVNLRKEVYDASSRIPVSIDFGTPEEDAYRRDITINALFYNIHTYEVEDFTNKGKSDMKERLIRTPLPAYETFKDDPLRVLRCIRFASRFQFEIVDDVKNAIKENDSIKTALNEKISRERIGLEVDKMIKGHDPTCAINLIVNLGLYDIVFSPPPQETIVSGKFVDTKICLNTAKILKWLISDESKDYDVHPKFRQLDENEKRKLYLAVCTLPYKDMVYTEKKKRHPACRFVVRERLKFSNEDVDKVSNLLSSVDSVKNAVAQNNEAPANRVALGLLIRELGSGWLTNLLFALSNELMSKFDNMDKVKEVNNKYTKFIERVQDLKLENVFNEKPILNDPGLKKYWIQSWNGN
ncbi:5666_t:CDS:10 [Funneliformis geosporum]|uniref:2312_t:CDS:1 n=1 Tax=Funneliformis geosporum TaxID=1117311 RepID=A0A9W4WVR5_9GLOM|nr:5666_t:CDS:10 [Funneliformis geosporum]CAI2175757.1 2312_t:CDS:10 [Funneliformis geosporum]